MAELNIMTYNCRGLGSQEKRRDVVNFIRNTDFDIYLLQDTHLTSKTVKYFNALWNGKCYHAFGTFNSRGTAILFKKNIQHSIIHEEYSNEGNFVIIVCKIFLYTYAIVSIYGPNDDQPSFFKEINQKLQHITVDNIIIGGDFNFVPDLSRDSNYVQINNPRARDAFIQLENTYSLVDVWRELNPNSDKFTWMKQNPLKYGRLDRIYIYKNIL